MTGFGKAERLVAGKRVTAEIKSLNSKQLDLSTRLPQAYRELELELRDMVARGLERGRVDLTIFSEAADESCAVSVNIPLLKSYKKQIELMARELNLPAPADWYTTLLRLPDAVKADSAGQTLDPEEAQAVKDAVAQAIEALAEFRAQEGSKLETFFRQKIDNIAALLKEVEKYEPERVAKVKARITDALAKIGNADYDQNRFEQEMIYYIEKLDITEEKTRLRNHLEYFIATIDTGRAQGKKLSFIAQEMGREINTLGSKSNHGEMQNVVVRMKDELEQIKEQVLNVL